MPGNGAMREPRREQHGSGGERRRGSGGAGVWARQDEEQRHGWRGAAAARVRSNRAVNPIWGSNDLIDGPSL
jgi:hypothetical protein